MRVKTQNLLGDDSYSRAGHVFLVSAYYLDKIACLKDCLDPSIWTSTAHYTSIAITRSFVLKYGRCMHARVVNHMR